MGKGKDDDPVVRAAELLAKQYKLPLANVANIMQKHSLDAKGLKAATEECGELAATEMLKYLKKQGIY